MAVPRYSPCTTFHLLVKEVASAFQHRCAYPIATSQPPPPARTRSVSLDSTRFEADIHRRCGDVSTTSKERRPSSGPGDPGRE
eukprot:scaffold662_cov364-Pavlova_lutheri.AAC.28